MSNINLHDTHIHLEMLLEKLGYGENFRKYNLGEKFSNLDTNITITEIQKGFLNEVLINHQFVIQSTVSTSNFDLVWQLFNFNPKVFFLMGSHPEIIQPNFDLEGYLLEQKKFLSNFEISKICGIGEVGLDYHYTKSNEGMALQKKLFISQIELAIELNLPLVIHCRDAFDDLIEILKKYQKIWGKFLIHCFTGNVKNLQDILELEGFVALGGIVTYSNTDDLAQAVKYCPMSNIVIETDAPYLTPLVHRGNKICLPEYIQATVSKIAEIKELQDQDVLDFSKHNAIQLFPLIKKSFGQLSPYLTDE